MGIEVDLLKNYPKTKRNVKERGAEKTLEDKQIAQEFGEAFFDGDRKTGYGGFHYHPRFWQPVIPSFKQHFKLTPKSSVLDVGCAKGFMLYDLQQSIPGITCRGLDISRSAIDHAKEEIKDCLSVGNALHLPFEDNSFDVVISITTLHNFELNECAIACKEVERVSKEGSFITVDAYRNDEEKEAMYAWNLTAKTIMHVDEWKAFFKEVGYTGDYYWFLP